LIFFHFFERAVLQFAIKNQALLFFSFFREVSKSVFGIAVAVVVVILKKLF
jgi:hypothetical protein